MGELSEGVPSGMSVDEYERGLVEWASELDDEDEINVACYCLEESDCPHGWDDQEGGSDESL